jgi:hypothetical protein
MSYWTLKFLEIMIALFYVRHIMLKRCLKDLNKRFEHFDYATMSTPYDSKIHLIKNHGDAVLQEKYEQFIDSLIF